MDHHSNGFFNIVMADDDPDDRFIAERAIKEIEFSGSLGFAHDGEELLSYLNQCFEDCDKQNFRSPDLILMDLNMPVKDGWETLSEIKESRGLQDIPIVIWTTSNNDDDRLKCLEMGADRFITKPYNYSSLLFTIRELIETYCGNHNRSQDGFSVSNV